MHHGFLLQPVLIWWALFCAGVIDWPFKKKGAPKSRYHP